MKTSRTLLFLVFVFVAARAFATPFEGKIELRTTEGKKSFTTTYYYAGEKMRIESSASGESGAMILDFPAKQMMMLMPSEKMYMVMNIGGQMEQAQQGDSNPPVKSGRTETILGYECHEYIVTERKTVTEYWAAQGLGVFRAMTRGGPGGPPQGPTAWETEAQREGLFPLRTIERSLKGKELSRTEATAVTPGDQPAALFAAPAGFTKFEMPSFGKMFGN